MHPLDPSIPPGLPEESWVGKGFISLSTIFWYKALKLNGSTVKGSVPVSMAYMFTPLKENRQKKKPKWSGTRKNGGFGDCTSSLMSDSYCRVDAPSLRTFQVRLKRAPDPAGDVPALCNNNYKLQKKLTWTRRLFWARISSSPEVQGLHMLGSHTGCWRDQNNPKFRHSCSIQSLWKAQRQSYERQTQSNCARAQVKKNIFF